MKLFGTASQKMVNCSGRTGSPWLRKCCALVVVLGVGSVVAQTSATTPAPTAVKAAASAPAAVTVVLTQAKVVKGADGKEVLIDAAKVKPGDVLEYRVTYTNRSAKAVSGLVGELPIPEGLEYQPNTARPAAPLVKAATKDKVFAAMPLTRKVGAVQENVPYSDYRALRWSLGQLPAGGEISVSARAAVQSYVAPAAGVPASGAATAQAPTVLVPVAAKP